MPPTSSRTQPEEILRTRFLVLGSGVAGLWTALHCAAHGSVPILNYAYSAMGPSTVPHRTPDGWLVLWHAIMNNCSTTEYSVGDVVDQSRGFDTEAVCATSALLPAGTTFVASVARPTSMPAIPSTPEPACAMNLPSRLSPSRARASSRN